MLKLAAVVLFACAALSVQAADAPKTFKAGDYTFTRPEKFEWVPIQPGMRVAQMKVGGKSDKESAEIIFFHFPEGAGTVQANVDRWFAQFKEPKEKINARVEKITREKGEITYVQAEGTYLSGMPGGPKTEIPNAMLQGAIIEGADANIFIRMTGPARVVKGAQDDFKKMVEGALK